MAGVRKHPPILFMPPSNRTREEETLERLKEHSLKLNEEQTTLLDHEHRITILERIVVSGDSERKPLVEVMRNLETKLDELISSRAAKDKEDKDNRKFIRNAIVTALIGVFFSVVVPSIIQIFLFWSRIYPILEKLYKGTP